MLTSSLHVCRFSREHQHETLSTQASTTTASVHQDCHSLYISNPNFFDHPVTRNKIVDVSLEDVPREDRLANRPSIISYSDITPQIDADRL